MAIKDVCLSVYYFFSWPFRKLAQCFKKGSPAKQKESSIAHKISLEDSKRFRRKKSEEFYVKVHFKPLFLPDHFSAMSDSKNDEEFKLARERSRKKEESIREREKLMKRLRKCKNGEVIDTNKLHTF
jgi:hypothetical protein